MDWCASPGFHPGYEPLRAQVESYLSGDPASYGIMFLDLGSGMGFGVNPDRPVPQASTVKVPIVLYVNYLIRRGLADWRDRVEYQPGTDYRGGAGAMQFFARPGSTYSLRLLTNLVITLSDNVAKAMLVRHFGPGNIVAFMAALGASSPRWEGEAPTTARDMTIYLCEVLRLARECPELGCRVIDDLSFTIFDTGLPLLLPRGLQVAHKEGDITGVADDVGIVFSRHPYILSVLSEGQRDVEAGFRKIAEISRMVFDYQEQAYAFCR
ncbi:MAG: serine hydrolase [Firmicutes bacterium]|nr:serine hydrolase [Bacillota bacterium]